MKFKILLLLICIVSFVSCDENEQPLVTGGATGSPNGTAILITGAAARITQELALLEALDNQGKLNNVTFISGVSSGAINTIMLNAVLDKTNNFEWQDYKDIVLNLGQDQVLTNDKNNLPVNTQPLWRTFENTFVNILGYESMDDLPFPSAVTATRLDLQELAVASNIETLATYSGRITEVIMASASFPVAFPSIKIDGNIYADGGLEENIPARVALEYQVLENTPFDTIYVVSYQKNASIEWDRELGFLGVESTRKDILEISLERAGFDTDQLSEKAFNDNLRDIKSKYPEFASRIMVYVPEVNNLPYFGVFDFTEQTARESYNAASLWATTNNPVSLDDYLTK